MKFLSQAITFFFVAFAIQVTALPAPADGELVDGSNHGLILTLSLDIVQRSPVEIEGRSPAPFGTSSIPCLLPFFQSTVSLLTRLTLWPAL